MVFNISKLPSSFSQYAMPCSKPEVSVAAGNRLVLHNNRTTNNQPRQANITTRYTKFPCSKTQNAKVQSE